MRQFPTPLITESQKLAPSSSWIWLVEINLGGEIYRIASNNDSVTFDSKTFQPFGFIVGDQDATITGDLAPVTITFDDATREIARAVELNDGLLNARFQLWLVNTVDLSVAAVTQTFNVQSVTVTQQAVAVVLGAEDLFSTQLPVGRFLPRCRWVYGSPECGYNRDLENALQTCDKTLDGANGCQAHGNDEVSRGVSPVNHPRNFGGFPGLIKR